MVHKVLLWGGFGIAVRLWQLAIEMRPLFNRGSLWVYPIYAGVGGGFGYWLLGVEQRQMAFLAEKRESLMAKRRRRAEQNGSVDGAVGSEAGSIVESAKAMMGSVTGSKQEEEAT